MTEVDDIQSFITAQKKRIEKERVGLAQANVGRRNIGHHDSDSLKLTQGNSTSERRQKQPKAVRDVTSSEGLPLGSYQSVQERLRKERAEEYRKFLAEKNYRTTGRKSAGDHGNAKVKLLSPLRSALQKEDYSQESTMDRRRKVLLDDTSDEPYKPRGRARPQKTLDELYDAYEELLERKRQDERRYRGIIDDPFLDPRRVRFDDESKLKPFKKTWLENGRRRRWDTLDNGIDNVGGRRYRETENVDVRTFDDYQEKSRSRNQDPGEDRISRSAPSTAVPLLGEHDLTPEAKQQRQSKYREELQAQIKEREMQKKREKDQIFGREPRKEVEKTVKPTVQSSYDSQREGNLSGLPRQENPGLPRQQNLGLSTQFGLDQPYSNPYSRQPYNYPAGLPPNNVPFSTFNASSMLGRYPMSIHEPLGGYQPSWANDPTQGQRTSGLVTSVGRTGDASMENRHSHGTGQEKSTFSDFNSGFSALPYGEQNKEKDRSKQQSYREELTRQMIEKEMRKKKVKEDNERYNIKLEQEIAQYDPWGKSGGGAPIKDEKGRLVSDLRMMHQYNKEGTIISPRDRSAKLNAYLNKEQQGTTIDVAQTTAVSTVANQDSARPPMQTEEAQKKAKLEYQEFLRKQVEEKQRKKKEEEERLRELDARQDKIIQEQQEKLRNEYEKEIEAARKKEEAARLKNEEIRQAAEQKKKEMEQRRKEEDRKQEEKLRKQLDERLRAAKAKDADRSVSPPVPALQGQVRSSSPPIPTLQRKREEETRSGSPSIPTLQNQMRSNSPPIPTLQRRKETETTSEPPPRPDLTRQTSGDRATPRPSSNTNRSRKQTETTADRTKENKQETLERRPPSVTADIDILSQLTSLRRQLKNEEIKVQQQLTENKEKYVKLRENSASRRNKKPGINVFDNVLRRKPAVSQKDQDLKSFGAMEEFNKLKYEDTSSLHGDFISRYPDPATTTSTLDLQQKSLLRQQQKRLQVFRDTLQATDKENVESYGNSPRPTSKTSQLESDSQFVSVEDPSQVLIDDQGKTSKPFGKLPSARERRRWKQLENLAKSPKLTDYKPPTPGGFSLNSVTSFNVDELAQKNEERLRKLEAMKQARSETKRDPNEVLKKFIEQHSRPDSKVSENSLPGDERHLPNM